MQQPAENIKEAFRANVILFYALFIGVTLFMLIFIGLHQVMESIIEDKNFTNIFLIISSFIAITCLAVGTTIYKKRISKIVNAVQSLHEKLNHYREAMIVYLAACEGAALFAVICFFLTGNYWFVAIVCVMLAAMLYRMPTKQRLTIDLQLNSQEQQEL